MTKLSTTLRLRVSDEEHVMAKLVASARGLSVSALIRTLLHAAHLDYQERREQVRRAALLSSR